MEDSIILNKVLLILQNNINVNKNLLIKDNYNKSLTGNIFRFTALELTYLFNMVEKEFNLIIDTDSILNYEFNTITGIVSIIKETQCKQDKC